MKNEFDQHKAANGMLIGALLTGAAAFLGKKMKEKKDEKKEKTILEIDNYKFSKKK